MIQTMSDYKPVQTAYVKGKEVKLMYSEAHRDWAVTSSIMSRAMFGYTKIGARNVYSRLTGYRD